MSWLLILFCSFLLTDARVLHHRVKRQIQTTKYYRQGDYQLPSPFYSPSPGQSASGAAPLWPFTGQYNGGIKVAPANKVAVDGFINVPIPGWGIWDLKGGLKTGRSDTSVGVGTVFGPINPLKISPQALNALGNDPNFQQARSLSPTLPVAVLPGNYAPLSCKPPFCNPYVHSVGVGVEVEPGNDPFFDGGLDFPIPLGPYGLGSRFPLSGGIEFGDTPVLVNYGHKLGPVDPFLDLPKYQGAPRPLLPNNNNVNTRSRARQNGARQRPTNQFAPQRTNSAQRRPTSSSNPFGFPPIPRSARRQRQRQRRRQN